MSTDALPSQVQTILPVDAAALPAARLDTGAHQRCDNAPCQSVNSHDNPGLRKAADVVSECGAYETL